MKAYAIHTIHRRPDPNEPEQVVRASTSGMPSVFDLEKEEFDRLEALGAVRKATKEELAVSKAQQAKADGVAVAEEPDEAAEASEEAEVEPVKHRGGRRKKSEEEEI
jgi:hypothetical protein